MGKAGCSARQKRGLTVREMEKRHTVCGPYWKKNQWDLVMAYSWEEQMMGNGRNPGLRKRRHLTLSFEEQQLHMEGRSRSSR